MELGSIWLGGFRLGVLDCPPGTPDPKEFPKPTPALLMRAVKGTRGEREREKKQRMSICGFKPTVMGFNGYRTHDFMMDLRWIDRNTHTVGSSCLQHFSVAGIQDSHVVCNSSNER